MTWMTTHVSTHQQRSLFLLALVLAIALLLLAGDARVSGLLG